MRDLLRNYRMLLKRKNESDSETESQPLMSSSSSSSSRGFGAIKHHHHREPCMFDQDSFSNESDVEIPIDKSLATSPLTPVALQKRVERQLLFPASYETPELDIFSKSNNFLDRYQHYSRINGLVTSDDSLRVPPKDLILDPTYADYKDIEVPNTNNSMVTIFAIWNTTLGSSLLAMSWGLEKTGLFSGIAINILVAGLCLYTAYLLLNVNEKHGMLGQDIEVSDLCKMLLGKWAEVIAKIFSLIVLIGANIVYWILMSNFLYNSIHFAYGFIMNLNSTSNPNTTVICPKDPNFNLTLYSGDQPEDHWIFDQIWNLHTTVPLFLTLIMFPMVNFKSATFFTKFNSLGTVSIVYLIMFVAIKSYNWGINVTSWSSEIYLKPSFCALSGMLSLSYFIHNIIISVMRNNRHQENNGRDLTIAFGLITFTYLFVGVGFYVSFPLAKSCIEDNILNNFQKDDVLTLVARILLLFQLFTVFPLMSYMLRVDIMLNVNIIFKNYRFGDFTYGRVIIINVVIMIICILFACFLPKIGTLIRYTGALSGLVYIFMLPSLLKIASLKKEDNLTAAKLIFHVLIIVVGGVNLLSQFFITDE